MGATDEPGAVLTNERRHGLGLTFEVLEELDWDTVPAEAEWERLRDAALEARELNAIQEQIARDATDATIGRAVAAGRFDDLFGTEAYHTQLLVHCEVNHADEPARFYFMFGTNVLSPEHHRAMDAAIREKWYDLSERDSDILTLRYIYRQRQADIARIVGVSQPRVSQIVKEVLTKYAIMMIALARLWKTNASLSELIAALKSADEESEPDDAAGPEYPYRDEENWGYQEVPVGELSEEQLAKGGQAKLSEGTFDESAPDRLLGAYKQPDGSYIVEELAGDAAGLATPGKVFMQRVLPGEAAGPLRRSYFCLR